MGIDSIKFLDIKEQIKNLEDRGLYFNKNVSSSKIDMETYLKNFGFTKLVNYVENALSIKDDYSDMISDFFIEFQHLSTEIAKIIAPEILKIECAFSESIIRHMFLFETKASNNIDARWFNDIDISNISNYEYDCSLEKQKYRFKTVFVNKYDWSQDKFMRNGETYNIENNVATFYTQCSKSWKRNYRYTQLGKNMNDEAIWHPIKTLSFGDLIRLYKSLNIPIQMNIIRDMLESDFNFVFASQNKEKKWKFAYLLESLSNLRNVIFHCNNVIGFVFARKFDVFGNSSKEGKLSLVADLGTVIRSISLFKCIKNKCIMDDIIFTIENFKRKVFQSIENCPQHEKNRLHFKFSCNCKAIRMILFSRNNKGTYAKCVYKTYKNLESRNKN